MFFQEKLVHHRQFDEDLKSCFVYNMKNDRWSEIADMNEERFEAACTVYEGKNIASGGSGKSVEAYEDLILVEAYDYYKNDWNYLPGMIERQK